MFGRRNFLKSAAVAPIAAHSVASGIEGAGASPPSPEPPNWQWRDVTANDAPSAMRPWPPEARDAVEKARAASQPAVYADQLRDAVRMEFCALRSVKPVVKYAWSRKATDEERARVSLIEKAADEVLQRLGFRPHFTDNF